MKYTEKKYQQLIEDIKSVYEDTCDTLKFHINELKQQLASKDEEIEKLKEGNKLQNEIDEYNRLEAQKNINLEDEITQLRAELNEIEKELKMASGETPMSDWFPGGAEWDECNLELAHEQHGWGAKEIHRNKIIGEAIEKAKAGEEE